MTVVGMGYSNRWPFFIFVLFSPLLAQGHDACFANNWQYHSHTHSCFRLIRDNQPWTTARDSCAREQLGSSYGVKTRLAKIDDANTNAFVRSLFPESHWQCHIGLHYIAQIQAYRWDGYPDETPKFTDPDWRDSSPSTPYVTILIDHWGGARSGERRHYVCQHRAKVIGSVTCQQQTEAKGLEITCTSEESPVKGFCEWTYKYTDLQFGSYGGWRPVNEPSYQENGDSFTTTCSATLSGVRLGVIAFRMKMYPDIPETSGLSTKENALSEGYLNITVAKPTNVTCHSVLHPNRLLASCQIDKIYPEALCQWWYHDETNRTFNPLNANGMPIYTHEVYTDSDGFLYYKSICSLTLTPEIMTFRPGDLTVQVTVKPNIEGIDNVSEAFFTTQEIVKIELPSRPIFKIHDRTIIETSSPEVFVENDQINLSCDIQSGNPTVYSLNLSCEFAFDDSDAVKAETDYVINITSSRDMNGKSCTCIGNHLTGPIESLPVTFDVKYSPDVKNFSVNGNEAVIEVDANEGLTFSCLADGNPRPSVAIRKLETSHVDTSTWQSDDSGSGSIKVERTVVARCEHNGRYRCSAHNTLNNHHQEGTKDLDVRVRCPPTFCDETSRDLKMAVRAGQSQTVELCVVAYPMPIFRLLKRSTTSTIEWIELNDPGAMVTQNTSFDSQHHLTISFTVLDKSHLGEYALEYPVANGTASSRLNFRLTEAESGGGGGDTGLVVGVVVAVVLSIIVVVVIFLLRRRRRNKPKESPFEGDTKDLAQVEGKRMRSYGPDDYTEIDLSTKRKHVKSDDQTGSGAPVYNNDGFQYENGESNDDAHEKADDIERTYSNMAVQNSPPDTKIPETKTAKGESEDDLVYIKLDFNYTSDKKAEPKKKSKPKDKQKKAEKGEKGERGREEEREPTEYAAISATATIRIKMEKEKEGEEDEEKEGKEEGEEETVYENVKAQDNVP